jgi:hypothetical protein
MILLLSGNPTNRRALVDMASLMTKRYGILFLAHIAHGPILYKTKEEITLSQKAWLRSKNIKAFYKLMESNSLSDGIKSLMQVSQHSLNSINSLNSLNSLNLYHLNSF